MRGRLSAWLPPPRASRCFDFLWTETFPCWTKPSRRGHAAFLVAIFTAVSPFKWMMCTCRRARDAHLLPFREWQLLFYYYISLCLMHSAVDLWLDRSRLSVWKRGCDDSLFNVVWCHGGEVQFMDRSCILQRSKETPLVYSNSKTFHV